MSESVIADFVAKFNSESTARGEPVKGRVLLSQKRLVLAANDEERATIPLTSIFDIAVGQVPEDLGDFFDATVTIAFEHNGNRHVAAVEAGEEKIDKFSTVLFKAVLNGTDMTIKHPARLGGRVTDAEYKPAKLFLQPRTVRFKSSAETIDIGLSTITGFERSSRKIGGAKRPVIEVRHMYKGQSTMTMAATESPRKMSILGRYLRLEYSELMSELRDVELSGDKKEILVALYSGAGQEGLSLANVVGKDSSQVTMLLNQLEDDGLVVDARDGTKLTPKGRVVVSNHLEDVNA
ncbi:CheF family chemotaxis protein [Salinibaculum rarum]|uniref:CheF family chemotaxis protein n=1 Tax=Salinibaculum rarum TaxID=3058903 RepID=UPI00265FCF2C|nr:CheF family chemotaxis protein [Salinibaculum sp. KK48]